MTALLGMFALLLTALVTASTAAQARPVTAAGAADCGTNGYPFQPDALVSSSATNVTVGQSIEVSGSNYCGSDDISITIGGKVVGSAHTNSTGSFDPAVKVPNIIGDAKLCAAGSTAVSRGSNSDCLTLRVSSAGALGAGAGSGSGSSSGSGGTSMTGVQIGVLVGLAALLVGGGAAFLAAGRSRRSTVPAQR